MKTLIRPLSLVVALLATLVIGALTASHASAQALQSGDILTPGDYGAGGLMWRQRGNTVTALFQSSQFGYPTDMIVD